MKNILKEKEETAMNFDQQNSAEAPAGASIEHALLPIAVAGVVIPSKEIGPSGWQRSFRLACPNGVLYVIETSAKWQSVLARYKWGEVKVVGLLNKARMAIIVQKLFPVGPNDSGLNMAGFAIRRVRRITKEIFGDAGDLLAASAALA